MPTPTKPKIYAQISKIMRDVPAIGKEKKNHAQGYNFRGIDDVYNVVNSVMAKHGVFSTINVLDDYTEERKSSRGAILIYRILKIEYTFHAEDGSSVSCIVIGEGMDTGDKASNKAMAVAHKYAIIQLLQIPTNDPVDPECESHEIIDKKNGRKTEKMWTKAQRMDLEAYLGHPSVPDDHKTKLKAWMKKDRPYDQAEETLKKVQGLIQVNGATTEKLTEEEKEGIPFA